VTKKMLDMFKRPTDPPEFYHLYGIPAAATMALYSIGSMSGKFPQLDAAASTLAGLLCIGGIGGLASQSTARLGAVSGQAGVALGVASTMGHLSPSFGTAAGITALMGAGAVAGKYIGDRVQPTSLPQTVAAFHSLVGLAASAAAVGDYCNAPDPTQLDGVHLAAIYLATVIGSVTFTGSLVAFGKLDGRLPSAPLKLAARDRINIGLGAITLGAGGIIMGAPELGTGMHFVNPVFCCRCIFLSQLLFSFCLGMVALGTALTTSGVLGEYT
jgi:H+-translocating NAD(P) transhydrogenase